MPAPQSSAQPSTQVGGFDANSLTQALIAKGYNQIDAQNAANGPRAQELAREYLGGPATGAGMGMGSTQPTINLPDLYNSLYSSSGISEFEKQLSDQTRQYNEAVSKINDNPFLSEASRTGRLQKLQTDFNNTTANTRNDIATRKADIETQLNLQTKQFDINSQQAQQELSKFSALLESGALNNVSPEDIANLTRTTGLSSNIIKSAIQQKIQSGLSTSIQSFDNGVDEGFTIYTIDPQGNIVNQTKQVTGKSTKASKYSGDPAVSSFLESYLKEQSNISDLWNDIY